MVRTLKLPEEPKASSSLEAGPRFGPGVETTLVCLITHCGWTCGNFVDDFFLVEIAYFVEKCIEQLNPFTDDYPPLKRKFAPETLGLEDEFHSSFWEGLLRGGTIPPIPSVARNVCPKPPRHGTDRLRL